MSIVAMLPTYNERDNISDLIQRILALRDDVEVLVVDDSSPDGTAGVVLELAGSNPRVHLIVRSGARGRGYAGAEGFRRAVEMVGRDNVYFLVFQDNRFVLDAMEADSAAVLRPRLSRMEKAAALLRAIGRRRMALDVALVADDDGDRLGIILLDNAKEFDTTTVGHVVIGDDEGEGLLS